MKCLRTPRSGFTSADWSPTGTLRRDPALELAARSVRSRFDSISAAAGFRPVGLSATVERSELEKSSGTSSDVVAKELVALGDAVFTPEGTPQVISLAFESPGRYSYDQTMMRAERIQRGRLREFNQLGVEEISSTPIPAAQVVESLGLLVEVLDTECTVRMGFLGCSDCRSSLCTKLRAVFAACPDCVRRQQVNPLRMLDCKSCDRAVWPTFDSVACTPCRTERNLVVELTGATWDPFLVRGLDYYTGPVFEVDAGGLTVAGGGMFQASVTRGATTRTLYGLGWALGLERLLMLTEPPVLPPGPPVLAGLVLDCDGVRAAQALATQTGRVLMLGKLKDVLRRADRMSAPSVLIVGRRELDSGVGIVKDLATGRQEPFPL